MVCKNQITVLRSVREVMDSSHIRCPLFHIQSSRDERNLYIRTFKLENIHPQSQNYDLNATFVAEALWDRYNRLLVVACQLLNPSDYIQAGTHSLRYYVNPMIT